MWTTDAAIFMGLLLLFGSVYAVARSKVGLVKFGTEMVVGLLIMFSVLLIPLLTTVALHRALRS